MAQVTIYYFEIASALPRNDGGNIEYRTSNNELRSVDSCFRRNDKKTDFSTSFASLTTVEMTLLRIKLPPLPRLRRDKTEGWRFDKLTTGQAGLSHLQFSITCGTSDD